MKNTDLVSIISDLTGVLTGIVLILWFFYSRRNTKRKEYFDLIDGSYSNYTPPTFAPEYNGTMYAGMIMRIREANNDGYFFADMHYKECESATVGGHWAMRLKSEGIFFFKGRLNYRSQTPRFFKYRDPFKVEDNRTYLGEMFMVDRLDFDIQNQNLDQYVRAIYKLIHYRDLNVIKLEFQKQIQEEQFKLPKSFTLQKKLGIALEPYDSLKHDFFYGINLEN